MTGHVRTARPDLAALTDDALAASANRGLVKRAQRMVAEAPPELSVSETRIAARFDDGVVTELPSATPFNDASCSCGANAVCRHRIGLVLAYRASHVADVRPPDWTPAEFDDTALEKHLGATVLARAERIRRKGYSATVHRARSTDPAVTVELPHCTVRFLVPHELAHARSSASDHTTSESIALAVWAVRAADESDRDDVYVSSTAVVGDSLPTSTARGIARSILLDGLTGASGIQHGAAARATRVVKAGSAVWLADACAELTDHIEWYASRNARHTRIGVAQIIAEIHARVELGTSADLALAAMALGTESSGETPLRRSRLVGLGAVATQKGEDLDVDIYLGDADSDAVYLMRRQWTDDSPTGHTVAGHKFARTTVRALAGSTVVTESAVRSSNREVRLGRGGIGRTSILPLGSDAWQNSVRVERDYAAAYRRLRHRAPSFARERLMTEGVGVLGVVSVVDTDYDPSEQASTVLIEDGSRNRARVVIEHRAETPGAINAVLRSMSSRPRAIAGRMTAHKGALCITPFAIACDLGVVVPDLEPYAGATDLTRTAVAAPPDPLEGAVAKALSHLADLSHRGLRYAREPDVEATIVAAEHLNAVGMQSTGCVVRQLADALAGTALDSTADAWVRAVLRLIVANECR